MKSFSKKSLLLIGVLVILGMGYFYYRQYSIKEEAINPVLSQDIIDTETFTGTDVNTETIEEENPTFIGTEKKNKTIEPLGVYKLGLYTVNVSDASDYPGNNITVSNEDGIVFSIQGYFVGIISNYILIDQGTSFERDFFVYDLKNKSEIFSSSYSSPGLAIEGNKIKYSYLVYSRGEWKEERINNHSVVLPECDIERGESLGYVETRFFDLDSKQVEKTRQLGCHFVE